MALRRCLALVVVACALAGATPAFAEPAQPADEFVDSIGVNVHMTYQDTAYRDRPLLVDKLAQAGIRHVRDGLSWNTDYAYTTFNQLADRGIHTTFIMGDPSERRDTLDQLLQVLRTRVNRAAEAAEGPNEYSYSGDPQWVEHLRAYQARLYQSVKSDPQLSRLPVIAPSLLTWQDYAAIGDMRGSLDYGNKHSYPGGDAPEGNMDFELSTAARMSGEKPVWVTESGYHNGLATTSGHRPASEAAAATYLPRMYLEYFRRGVRRTFAYELVDEWPDAGKKNLEANFGLLRNDYSEKPSYRALSNLIALLSDKGPSFAPQPLPLSISGAPADLRKLVLQKRDGSYFVLLWRTARVWDPVARKPVVPDSRPVTLRLTTGALAKDAQASLIGPRTSTKAFATGPVAGGIPVSLGADVVAVELPAGVASAAPLHPMEAPGEHGGRVYLVKPAPATGDPTRRLAPVRVSLSASVRRATRIRTVLRHGLRVRCRAPRLERCGVSATRGRRVVAWGGRVTGGRRAASVRGSLTPAGRRLLRRALAHRRAVALRLRVTAPGQGLISRVIRLRP